MSSSKEDLDTRLHAKFCIFLDAIRLFFKLNNYKGCVPIFHSFEGLIKQLGNKAQLTGAGQGFGIESLPIDTRVLYYYFKGRFHLYNDQLDAAKHHLRQALSLIEPNESLYTNEVNTQMILRFLVPVEMIGGRMPTE